MIYKILGKNMFLELRYRYHFKIFFLMSFILWFSGILIPILSKNNNLGGFTQDFSKTTVDAINLNHILFHNISVVVSIVILGIFTFGIYSIITTFINGYMLGTYMDYAIFELNIPIGTVIKGVLPHFLEFIAIWLSSALSVYCLIIIFRSVLDKKGVLRLKELMLVIKIFILIIFFIFVAAEIEVNISYPLIKGN